MIKQKIFKAGAMVECELNHFGFPRHDMSNFTSGSNRWVVGRVVGVNDVGEGPELIVDFLDNNLFFDGKFNFPLEGHKRVMAEHWSSPGSLKVYGDGATREPHCQYDKILGLGTIPLSTMSSEDYYRSYFRKLVQNKYRKWPVCKIEDKTLDIKHYFNHSDHIVTATFECQYCCF